MFPATNTRIRALLARVGREVVIERVSQTGTDRLNHASGSYESVGTELCALYNPDSGFGKTEAGELNLDSPSFAFPLDSDIRANDHIIYDGVTYEVETVTTRPTWQVVRTKSV